MISDPHGPDNPNAIWGLTLESLDASLDLIATPEQIRPHGRF